MRTLVLLLTLAQAQATPQQLIDQISTLLQQLKQSLAPAPPTSPIVDTADKLTAALKVGGNILLAPGTYTGNFVITKPTVLTGAGQATTMLVPKDKLSPTLAGYVGADDVVVQELTVQNGAPDRDTVVLGTLDAKTAAEQPHRVRLVHIAVTAVGGGHRGVSLNGTDMTVDRCTITGFTEKGRDSQAILIVNGPGPYTITNNVLEASGENLLVGGADPGIPGVVPSDITIRGNTIRKPATYRTTGTVKNLLELKTGVRVLIENNVFDGNWADGQSGNAIVFTTRNQGGKCPQCEVNDVVFRNNTVTNALDGFGVNILGYDDTVGMQSVQTKRITIDHNLFDTPYGLQITNGPTDALIITNNTLPKITNKFLQWGVSNRPITKVPLTFSRNVTKAGEYGIAGDGSVSMGVPSLMQYANIVEWNGNIIENGPGRVWMYPTGVANQVLANGALAALLNPTTFKLLSGTAGY
jgi:hypothetical protein